jgi:hypothetical protein
VFKTDSHQNQYLADVLARVPRKNWKGQVAVDFGFLAFHLNQLSQEDILKTHSTSTQCLFA